MRTTEKWSKMLFAGMAVMALALVLASCGGNDPKALAKQTYDIGQQALGALFNPAKAAELTRKAEDIEKKVAKLSPEDKAVYDEELVRLAGNALGDMFKAATDAVGGTQDLLKAASSAADALNAVSGSIDGKWKHSEDNTNLTISGGTFTFDIGLGGPKAVTGTISGNTLTATGGAYVDNATITGSATATVSGKNLVVSGFTGAFAPSVNATYKK